MGETILSAHQLSFAYRDDAVLKDISFTINKGDFVALVGANGSGKSTLLKIILGFLKPDKGHLIFKENQANLAYIPQGGIEAVDFLVSVQELLLFRKKRSTLNEVREALSAVGLSGFEKKLVKNLSGGQRQRVLIARELMANPDIIFLDEPTNGLDSASIEQLNHLMIALNKNHTITLVMVTHHIDDIFTQINRVLQLKDGTLEELDNV